MYVPWVDISGISQRGRGLNTAIEVYGRYGQRLVIYKSYYPAHAVMASRIASYAQDSHALLLNTSASVPINEFVHRWILFGCSVVILANFIGIRF